MADSRTAIQHHHLPTVMADVARFLGENRASVSVINSAGDARVSFLGPMEVTKDQAESIRLLLAAWEIEKNGRTEPENPHGT